MAMPPAVKLCDRLRQPWRYRSRPPATNASPTAMPMATLSSSPIQRFSNAYFRKKAAAQKISATAIHPTHICPITASICWWDRPPGLSLLPSADGAVTGSTAGGGSTAGDCRINLSSAASTPARRISIFRILLVRTSATTSSTMQRHSSAAAIKTSACMLVQPDVILVITALHKPAARLAIDAIERAVRERNVPFIARPGIGSPPVARHAPWSGIVQHFAANTLGRDETGMARGERYLRRPRRAKHAERKPGRALTGLDLLARSEFGHTERLGAMRIEQLRRPHATLADEGLDPRQCQTQLYRFRRPRRKQPTLCRPRFDRVHAYPDMNHGGLRRVRLQVQLQQLQKRHGIERGCGKRNVRSSVARFSSFSRSRSSSVASPRLAKRAANPWINRASKNASGSMSSSGYSRSRASSKRGSSSTGASLRSISPRAN